MNVGKQHAEDEQGHYAELEEAARHCAWGAYYQVASEVAGDTLKAEAVAEMLLKVGRKEVRIDEQHEEFERCLFG